MTTETSLQRESPYKYGEDITTPDKFSTLNYEDCLKRPPQTMLLQHQSNAALQREQTPSSRILMQSLETGGIQHSGDEQGRAPLESQSSKEVTDEPGPTNINTATASVSQHNKAQQLLEKAVKDLTVIQETTFEQTAKGQ